MVKKQTHSFYLLFASAVLLNLSYIKLQLWQPAWFAFIPLLFAIRRAVSPTQAILRGYTFGVLFFSFLIYWVYNVAIIWTIVPVLFYAIPWALFAFFSWKILKEDNPLLSFLWIPVLGVFCEWLRAEIPIFHFAWALTGYSQSTNLPVLQFAGLFGTHGISWLVYLVNVGLFLVMAHGPEKKTQNRLILLFLIVLISGVVFYGFRQLEGAPSGKAIRVGLIQPNVAQETKWDPRFKDLNIQKMIQLLELVRNEGPDLVILPEAAYPGLLNFEYEGSALQEKMKDLPFPLIIGAPNLQENRYLFNSAYLLEGERIKQIYNKLRLVPFGEYIPFESFFTGIGLKTVADAMGVGNFSAGQRYTLFLLEKYDVRFATLICFEDTMAGLARTFVQNGAGLLINITNDAWFRDTAAPYQHLQASVLRAVENGRYVLRAANTGVSVIISNKGKITKNVVYQGKETFITGSAVGPVFIEQNPTIYSRVGYLLPQFFTGLLALFWLSNLGKIFLLKNK